MQGKVSQRALTFHAGKVDEDNVPLVTQLYQSGRIFNDNRFVLAVFGFGLDEAKGPLHVETERPVTDCR